MQNHVYAIKPARPARPKHETLSLVFYSFFKKYYELAIGGETTADFGGSLFKGLFFCVVNLSKLF